MKPRRSKGDQPAPGSRSRGFAPRPVANSRGGDLARLLNLGPKSSAWLREAGFLSRDDIVRAGTIEACRRVRTAGHPVSVLLAYAIEGALMDVHWNALPFEFKQSITANYRRMVREEELNLKAKPAAR